MNNQTHKPYTKNRSRRSLHLLAVMVAGSAAGIHGNGTAAVAEPDPDFPPCVEYREPDAGWPLADDVPVPCGRLPNALMVEPLPRKEYIEGKDIEQIAAPATYAVVRTLPNGRARINKRKLPRYANIYGQELLIGSKVEPQSFAIDGINPPAGPIVGQFFNTNMAYAAEGGIALHAAVQFQLGDRLWQIASNCDAVGSADLPKSAYACRIQSETADTSQVLMRWNWRHDRVVTPTDGHFDIESEYSVSPTIVFAGDIDGDEKLDLLLVTSAYREAGCAYWQLLSERQDGKLMLAASTVACD